MFVKVYGFLSFFIFFLHIGVGYTVHVSLGFYFSVLYYLVI